MTASDRTVAHEETLILITRDILQRGRDREGHRSVQVLHGPLRGRHPRRTQERSAFPAGPHRCWRPWGFRAKVYVP